MYDVMLTTIDNPFDPFTQFDDWFLFDEQKGYHSCSLLDAFSNNSNELSEADQIVETERAINEILFYNPFGKHKKVKRELQ